jgi:hypothetical protein
MRIAIRLRQTVSPLEHRVTERTPLLFGELRVRSIQAGFRQVIRPGTVSWSVNLSAIPPRMPPVEKGMTFLIEIVS